MQNIDISFIKTVKNNGIGYLVNDVLFVPTLTDDIKQWIEKGNTPEPEFTDKELESKRIASIKAKAGEIIISKYPIIWQLNHPRYDEAYKLDYEWIDNIRVISNKAEINGTALNDIDWGL